MKNITKFSLGIFGGLLALAGVAVLGFFLYRIGVGMLSMVGTKIPTCIQIVVTEKSVPMTDADRVIVSTLAEANMSELRGSTVTNRISGNDNVYVFWRYPSHMLDTTRSRAEVCQWNRESDTWQSVSSLFEKRLAEQFVIEKATIHRDPGMFNCSGNCNVDVPLPLDFAKLNETVLKRP